MITVAKLCPRCGEVKQAAEFRKNTANANGLHTYCLACSRVKSAAYYQKNAEKIRATNRARSNEQYAEMLVRQRGACAICGEVPRHEVLTVDHDHKTGAVRGLLCRRCNMSLVLFDDEKLRARALDYIGETT